MGKRIRLNLKHSAQISVSLLFLFFATGCASGHCRKAQVPVSAEDEAASGSLGGSMSKGSSSDRVFVFKYDGSLQCNMGKPVSLDEMKKDLRGIPVYSMEKKPDGQMHIQVCGSITGQTNRYEISSKDLKEAEKRGFNRWNFE